MPNRAYMLRLTSDFIELIITTPHRPATLGPNSPCGHGAWSAAASPRQGCEPARRGRTAQLDPRRLPECEGGEASRRPECVMRVSPGADWALISCPPGRGGRHQEAAVMNPGQNCIPQKKLRIERAITISLTPKTLAVAKMLFQPKTTRTDQKQHSTCLT